MTLVLELTPETEARLKAIAESRGSTPVEFVTNLVTGYAKAVTPHRKLSHEEFRQNLDELAAIGAHLPPPPPGETYSRETIYTDDEY